MTLWLILAVSTLYATATLIGAAAQERAMMASRRELAADKRGRLLVGCIAPLGMLTTTSLWVVYSFEVGDWRFAAIAIIPGAVGLIVKWMFGREGGEIAAQPPSSEASIKDPQDHGSTSRRGEEG